MRIARAVLAALTLLVLAACSATAGGVDSADPSTSAEWSYTNGYGHTVTLPAPPKVIVTDAYSAASLWPYGIRPAGVFGHGLEKDAPPGELGDADVTTMTVVGRGNELDIEALAALQPDLIIGYGNGEKTDDAWTWWDEDVAKKVAAIAPFVGVKFSEQPVVGVIAEYEGLAEALGGDLTSEAVDTARTDFESAQEKVRASMAAKPELTAIAINGTTAIVWTGGPKLAQVALLNELGLKTVGPDDEDSAWWGEISWEKVPDYPADVVLAYTGSTKAFAEAPVYAKLPAVKAGQVVGWDDKMPFTYAQYAAWLTEVNAVLSSAKAVTG